MFIFEVAFTGSTEVGHIVQKAAGNRFKPYQTSYLSKIIFFLVFTDFTGTGSPDRIQIFAQNKNL
jgi:hypothetical protein